jgi:hypothetical protein
MYFYIAIRIRIKGTVYRKCVYGGSIPPKHCNSYAADPLQVEEKADPMGGVGGTPGDLLRIRRSWRIQIDVRTALGCESGRWGKCLIEKPETKTRDSVLLMVLSSKKCTGVENRLKE